MDAVAPGLLLAQAIGRWGNWWNQELFGKPTDLPWGLEIDVEHRPSEYFDEPTFHPTFLYESIYNLIGVGVLLLVERRFRIGRRPSSRSTSPTTPSDASSRSSCASTRRTSSPACALTRGSRPSSSWLAVGSSSGGSCPARERGASPQAAGGHRPRGGTWRSRALARPSSAPSVRAVSPVRDLELDLESFEGPFDLLLTLVLREELGARRRGRGRHRASRSSSASRSGVGSISTRAASSSSSSRRLLELKAAGSSRTRRPSSPTWSRRRQPRSSPAASPSTGA